MPANVLPYACRKCGHCFRIRFCKAAKPCPACGSYQVTMTDCGYTIVRGVDGAKTVGQVGEQNYRELRRKLGEEGAAAAIKHKVYGKGGSRLKLPKGAKKAVRTSGKVDVPWFRSGEVPGTGPRSEKPIDTRKIKDPVKYVRTGEKS